jgi:hypothetical protein
VSIIYVGGSKNNFGAKAAGKIIMEMERSKSIEYL